MHNPFRSLKYLPWSLLLLSAGLTVLVATAIDILLRVAVSMLPVLAGLLLSSPLIPMILTIAVPFGVGALAIFLTRQFFHQIPLRADTIWALVGCVSLILLGKDWLPMIPALFLRGFGLTTILMVAVGGFTASRRYWR